MDVFFMSQKITDKTLIIRYSLHILRVVVLSHHYLGVIMKDIVLFGIQGSGKGTQAALLQDLFGDKLSYFSSGDIFRALKSHPNAIGDFLSNSLESGKLISDEVTISMFRFYFSTLVGDDKMMLLDGYPRSLPQLVDLIQTSYKNKRTPVGIYFELDRETATERMISR